MTHGEHGTLAGKTIAQGAHGNNPGPDWNFGSKDQLYDHYADDYHASNQGIDEWWDFVKPNSYFTRQLDHLDRTRKLAAAQVGVQWQVYNDTTAGWEGAADYAQLKQQYDNIEGIPNRTDIQKDFLKQRAATRYMMKQISDVGYTRRMFDNLTGNGYSKDGVVQTITHENPYAYLPGGDKWNIPSSSLSEIYDRPEYKYKDDYLKSTAYYKGLPAWSLPGEDIIPDWVVLTPGRREKVDGSAAALTEVLNSYTAQ